MSEFNQYYINAAQVREIVAECGFDYAEFCVEQAESQCDVRGARAELNRIWNESCTDADAETEGEWI